MAKSCVGSIVIMGLALLHARGARHDDVAETALKEDIMDSKDVVDDQATHLVEDTYLGRESSGRTSPIWGSNHKREGSWCCYQLDGHDKITATTYGHAKDEEMTKCTLVADRPCAVETKDFPAGEIGTLKTHGEKITGIITEGEAAEADPKSKRDTDLLHKVKASIASEIKRRLDAYKQQETEAAAQATATAKTQKLEPIEQVRQTSLAEAKDTYDQFETAQTQLKESEVEQAVEEFRQKTETEKTQALQVQLDEEMTKRKEKETAVEDEYTQKSNGILEEENAALDEKKESINAQYQESLEHWQVDQTELDLYEKRKSACGAEIDSKGCCCLATIGDTGDRTQQAFRVPGNYALGTCAMVLPYTKHWSSWKCDMFKHCDHCLEQNMCGDNKACGTAPKDKAYHDNRAVLATTKKVVEVGASKVFQKRDRAASPRAEESPKASPRGADPRDASSRAGSKTNNRWHDQR